MNAGWRERNECLTQHSVTVSYALHKVIHILSSVILKLPVYLVHHVGSRQRIVHTLHYNKIQYDTQFALEIRQASYQFNLAYKIKRTETVLNENVMRETGIKVLLCKT